MIIWRKSAFTISMSENGEILFYQFARIPSMLLNREICYQAIVSHDRRFDGSFFVGVSSTKVYCRTVCTAKTPSIRNCRFFHSAAAAENAGFRPCLRCRPELAPGNAKIDAMNRAAAVVAEMIEDGALNDMSVGTLAERLGMSERHLRRVVEASFGVSPLELAQTQRLLLAKRLLADSTLSVTEIAYASGFSSLRRFNALLKERYGLSPRQMRSTGADKKSDGKIKCQLNYRPPYDFDSLLMFLKNRAATGVELVDGKRYYRTVRIGKEKGWLSVYNDPQKNALQLELSLSLSTVLMPVLNRLRRLFDLNACPDLIAAQLGSLAERHPGLRVPGAFDGFETALRAVLGQQVSVKAASTLMARFSQAFGESIETPVAGLYAVFPSPEIVAGLAPEKLTAIGITSARVQTILNLAKVVESGSISLEQAIDPEERIAQLKELPGIGDWTAHYIAMRCLSWPDAFPYSDLGIKKALSENNEKSIIALAESWRPWRSYAAMHLWKNLEV